MGIMDVIEAFKQNVFYPLVDNIDSLPNECGMYLICVKSKDVLPQTMGTLMLPFFEGSYIIYLGIAGVTDLMHRGNNHFHGNARNSTLRKSIGVQFGYEKLQYTAEIETSKYRFIPEHENILTEWMRSNLFMRYCITNEGLQTIEDELIGYFNPPLNLVNNINPINLEFRNYLLELRRN